MLTCLDSPNIPPELTLLLTTLLTRTVPKIFLEAIAAVFKNKLGGVCVSAFVFAFAFEIYKKTILFKLQLINPVQKCNKIVRKRYY